MADIDDAIKGGEVLQKYFDFDADSEVLLQFLPRLEMRAEVRKAEKLARQTGANSTDILNENVGMKCVKNWRHKKDHSLPGISIKGEPLHFSEENLRFLLQNSYRFSTFVGDLITNARAFTEAQEKSEVKNS